MTDSPTLKAVVSTLLTFAVIFTVSTLGSAIGQDLSQASAPSTVSSSSQADAPTHVAPTNAAPHNLSEAPVRSAQVNAD